jgi:hypothetical protein
MVFDFHFETAPLDLISKLEKRGIECSYYAIDESRDIRGFLFKHALETAYSNKFDFIVQFYKGWKDVYPECLSLMEDQTYKNFSLILGSRIPSKQNPIRRLFHSLTIFIYGLILGRDIRDVTCNGINFIRVKDFIDNYDDKVFNLSDDRWYIFDLLRLANHYKFRFKYLNDVETEHKLTTYKKEFSKFKNFLKKLWFQVRSWNQYLGLNKSVINPRTVKFLKRYETGAQENASELKQTP